MNTNQHILPEVAMSLAETGRYVDAQVAKGRALEDVLAERKGTGAEIWFDKSALRHFSEAVASSFAD